MIKTGLVSVSFRSLGCEEIIKITKESGLDGIEWGGDVHVPPADFKRARQVAEMTKTAGLEISAYGSYYRVGTYKDNYKDVFSEILETAEVLGAPVIRIWAGTTASDDVGKNERKRLTEECIEISKMAEKKGITLAFECHRNTLTDRYTSSLRLMKETDGRLKMFWQPNEEMDFDYNLEALKKLLPHLQNVHVFNWTAPGVKMPLAQAKEQWKEYISLIGSDKREHWCNLEFMPDDRPKTLKVEAETLKMLTAE